MPLAFPLLGRAHLLETGAPRPQHPGVARIRRPLPAKRRGHGFAAGANRHQHAYGSFVLHDRRRHGAMGTGRDRRSWRKGNVMRPFCRVVRKVGRWVPPPRKPEVGLDPKALIAKRLRAGMTQGQLAMHLGVSPRTLWNWEAGITRPTQDFWARVNAFLGP